MEMSASIRRMLKGPWKRSISLQLEGLANSQTEKSSKTKAWSTTLAECWQPGTIRFFQKFTTQKGKCKTSMMASFIMREIEIKAHKMISARWLYQTGSRFKRTVLSTTPVWSWRAILTVSSQHQMAGSSPSTGTLLSFSLRSLKVRPQSKTRITKISRGAGRGLSDYQSLRSRQKTSTTLSFTKTGASGCRRAGQFYLANEYCPATAKRYTIRTVSKRTRTLNRNLKDSSNL